MQAEAMFLEKEEQDLKLRLHATPCAGNRACPKPPAPPPPPPQPAQCLWTETDTYVCVHTFAAGHGSLANVTAIEQSECSYAFLECGSSLHTLNNGFAGISPSMSAHLTLDDRSSCLRPVWQPDLNRAESAAVN